MNFRFYVHREKPAWRLVLADGASFPVEARAEDWSFTRLRTREDTNPDVARLVDEKGFCLFAIGLDWGALDA